MSRKSGLEKSVSQRVANRAKDRRLAREDAFTAYAMDRFLYRLGRSDQAGEFILKGGILVANLVDNPHRFTRDIDVLRRHGPPDLDDIRQRFREVIAISALDGVDFDRNGVRAIPADHDEDGYDGVKVFVRGRVAGHDFDLRIDIGFGDAVVPEPRRMDLDPFLSDDEPAHVYAYDVGAVLAEKAETLLSKFPLIEHRLKDLLDIVVLAAGHAFDGPALMDSLRATLERRRTSVDIQTLDEIATELRGRKWLRAWAAMLHDKAVADPMTLPEAIAKLDAFLRPVLTGLVIGVPPDHWEPGGPWR